MHRNADRRMGKKSKEHLSDKSKIFQAEVMRNIEHRPDYWAGYCRGLQRAFHGEEFGTEEEHARWISLADKGDLQSHERGCGYLDGLSS